MRTCLKWLLIPLLALALVGGSFLVPVPLRPSKVTRENFDRVQDGMTADEVEAILGPDGHYHSGHYTVPESGMVFRRYWLGDEGFIIIEMSSGGPDVKGPWGVGSKRFFPVPRQTYGERWLQYFGFDL